MDKAVFHVYLTALTLCFGMSAAYHTMLCHSKESADLWMRLDYVGISVLIGGSFVPGLYMGLYCEMGLFTTYVGIVSNTYETMGFGKVCKLLITGIDGCYGPFELLLVNEGCQWLQGLD